MKKIYKYLLNTLPRPLLIRLSYIFRLFAPLAYKGQNVYCPVCDRHFKKFLSYGSNTAHRENVLCPYDLTLERHRLMWLYLQKSSFFSPDNIKLLHIAPEQCFYPLFKKQTNLDYTTADLESTIADLHFDLHEIPLEDNSFDVIFCNHVLEHVEDDHKCMTELYRVMKKDGWGIFQVPIDTNNPNTEEDPNVSDPKERERLYWQDDHVRLFGLDYGKRLEKAGFKVTESDFINELDPKLIQRYALPKGEIIYFCEKK